MYGQRGHITERHQECNWQTPPEDYLAEEEARIQALELEWQQREADEQPVTLTWDLDGVTIDGVSGGWALLHQGDEFHPVTLARGRAVREYRILEHQGTYTCTAQLVRAYQR